jgi:adenine-specific DNA-methyltransferase
MATGIPKAASKLARPSPEPSHPIVLSYEGKSSVAAVLGSESAPAKLLWQGKQSGSISNRLYFGDNLDALRVMMRDSNVRGHVSLIYIDPPYSTKSVFESRSQKAAYEDMLSGSSFVEFLRQRLILLRELLSDRGSIYLHLDENMVFAMKLVMDELFGAGNFRNFIVRKKCNPKNYTRKTYGNIADYLLFYSKSEDYVWHRPLIAWDDARAKREYTYTDRVTGRRFKKVPIHAPGIRNGETGKLWRGVPPPPGKHWQFPPRTLDEMDARGEIYWSATGNPRRKIFLDQSDGIPVQNIWLEFKDAHNQNIEITGYPTEKNSALLEQIISASSDEDDLILDCFAGSGTTLDVASRLGRHWIGVDNSLESLETILRRFKNGPKRMGDFVGRVVPDAPADWALPLFADDNGVEPVGKSQRSAICDFTLYQMENTSVLPPEVIALLDVEREATRVGETTNSQVTPKTNRKRIKYSAEDAKKSRKRRSQS